MIKKVRSKWRELSKKNQFHVKRDWEDWPVSLANVLRRRGKPQRGTDIDWIADEIPDEALGVRARRHRYPPALWACSALLAQRRAMQTLQGDIPEEGRVFQTAGGRRVSLDRYPPKELDEIEGISSGGPGGSLGRRSSWDERESRKALRWLERQTMLDRPTPQRPRNSPGASPADRSPRPS